MKSLAFAAYALHAHHHQEDHMPAIVQTNSDGFVTGWAIDRTMAGLAERVRASGHDWLLTRIDLMRPPPRGATYLGSGFTLIAGKARA